MKDWRLEAIQSQSFIQVSFSFLSPDWKALKKNPANAVDPALRDYANQREILVAGGGFDLQARIDPT
jgi:hypothetical protein